MRKNFRKAALSTICMLVVAIMSLTGATYAWFTAGDYAKVSGIEMTVSAATGGIWVSTDNQNWTQELTLNENGANDWHLATNGVAPVSTIGGTADDWSFFTAEVDAMGLIKPTATAHSTEEGASNNYIKQKLYLWNDGEQPITVAMGKVGTDDISSITGSNRDGYKAARVGIQYEGVTADATHSGERTGAGVCENDYAIMAAETEATYKGVKAASEGFVAANDASITDNVVVMDPTGITVDIPGYSVVELTVYVWIEGQDAECINDNAQSVFAVNLYFVKQQ